MHSTRRNFFVFIFQRFPCTQSFVSLFVHIIYTSCHRHRSAICLQRLKIKIIADTRIRRITQYKFAEDNECGFFFFLNVSNKMTYRNYYYLEKNSMLLTTQALPIL